MTWGMCRVIRLTIQQALLVLLFLVGVPGASAEESAPKSAYLKSAEERLPAVFCSEGSYFRTCFKVSESECRSAASASIVSCIQQYDAEIPKELKHPQDTAGWGAKLGACTGTKFEEKWKGKTVDSAECKAARGQQ